MSYHVLFLVHVMCLRSAHSRAKTAAACWPHKGQITCVCVCKGGRRVYACTLVSGPSSLLKGTVQAKTDQSGSRVGKARARARARQPSRARARQPPTAPSRHPRAPAFAAAPLPADIHGVVGPRRMPFRSLHMQVTTHCANTSRDVRHRQLKWACNLTLTCHLTWTCHTLAHLRM